MSIVPASQTTAAPTVKISVRAYVEVFDRDDFVDVYNRFRARVDASLHVRPLAESANVFKELCAEEWPEPRARRYSIGVRVCYQNQLDPASGEPLTGADLIHPLKIAEARETLVGVCGPAVAYGVLDRLIALGWRV